MLNTIKGTYRTYEVIISAVRVSVTFSEGTHVHSGPVFRVDPCSEWTCEFIMSSSTTGVVSHLSIPCQVLEEFYRMILHLLLLYLMRFLIWGFFHHAGHPHFDSDFL